MHRSKINKEVSLKTRETLFLHQKPLKRKNTKTIIRKLSGKKSHCPEETKSDQLSLQNNVVSAEKRGSFCLLKSVTHCP